MKSLKYNELRSQLIKVFWITICWTLFSIFMFMIGLTVLQDFNCNIGKDEPMLFFKGSIFTGILAGIIGGSGLVFLWEKWLRNKNYGSALFNIFWSYFVIYLIVSVSTSLFYVPHQLDLPIFSSEVWKQISTELFTLNELRSFITWLSVVVITLIVLLVNDKYGHGVFRSFLLGKYFHPKREERIFMFLDLRSSTTIAEQLGEIRYFNFIKNVFRDATPAIQNSRGEIYQYVGDEIIVSWEMDNGIQNANCLQCFFEVQLALQQKNNYYESTYDGIRPEFKAGLHYGYVMAGEIGVIKRDIAYSGDVLNTTARIQSKCNELGVNILFSKYLLEKLHLRPKLFTPQRIGDIGLRGKQKKVVLYTV